MITRLTVKLPDTLRRRAKAAATLRGETISDAIRTFLEEYTAEAEEAKPVFDIEQTFDTPAL